uniref:Uncharacterized protein n=1 Tax=Aegilops tauschii TaxID=37682 RepID=M8AV74_AEGTA
MEQHRHRRATPPAATILATNLLTHLLLEQASPEASPSTKPRAILVKLVKNGQELDGDYDEMLNLSDHDEVQPDDVQEEIDLDDYDEMLKFLGPKRLEMLMTCQVMALKSMKMYYVVDDKLKDWVMGSAVMYRMAIQAFGSGQVHDENRNATTSKLR